MKTFLVIIGIAALPVVGTILAGKELAVINYIHDAAYTVSSPDDARKVANFNKYGWLIGSWENLKYSFKSNTQLTSEDGKFVGTLLGKGNK